eukprot:10530112-Alexandrium_andersonii.AAC.1
MRRSESGTGAKKPRNAESRVNRRWHLVRKLMPRFSALSPAATSASDRSPPVRARAAQMAL